MRRLEAHSHSEVELRTPQAMRGALRLLPVLVAVGIGSKKGDTFVRGIKVGVETKWAEIHAIKPQGIAALTEGTKVLAEGRNALDVRAAGAQRSCRTTVSDTFGPRTGGGNANDRRLVTRSAGFHRVNRGRKSRSWKPRIPAGEGLRTTFDRVAERTGGLS